MSWLTLLSIAAGAFGFKALGVVVLGGRRLPHRLQACIDLLPAALLPALIVVNTFVSHHRLVIDARVPGVAAAALAAWRRAPLPVVILLGAAVTALVRWLGT